MNGARAPARGVVRTTGPAAPDQRRDEVVVDDRFTPRRRNLEGVVPVVDARRAEAHLFRTVIEAVGERDACQRLLRAVDLRLDDDRTRSRLVYSKAGASNTERGL